MNKTTHSIIPALATDLPDILELLEELNLDMDELHYAQFLIVKVKGELIAVGRIREYEDGVFELCSLGVLEDYRLADIGTDIIKALMNKHSLDSVYVVTEIPEYFEKTGFVKSTHQSVYLQDKLKRCLEEYACKNPVIMLCKHI